MTARSRTALSALLAALAAGCHSHDGSDRGGDAEPPTVAVAPVQRRDLYREVTLQAELRPYQEVDLDAKVTGYLKTISVDFGDRVKAGQLLATIEVPELANELEQAEASLQQAKASQANTHLNYSRLADVNRSQPHLIAQQDLDSAQAQDLAAAATVAAAQANLDRYRTLIAYTRITAPFAGVITQRYADPGALIRGGGGQAAPIVRLSQNDLLRVDFAVSVADAQSIHQGDTIELLLAGARAATTGRIARFARRISSATRTMETEVELPNPDLTQIPGGYATVTLRLDRRPGAIAVPVGAVSGGTSPTVDVVGADHRVREQPIQLGLETAQFDQALSGVQPGDLVVVAGRAALHAGQTVAPQTQ